MSFVDSLMKFVRPTKPAPTSTLGVGGTAIYGGYIQTNEQKAELAGRDRYRTFSDILANVTIVAAGTRYFLNLVSKTNWKVEPSDDSDEAQKMADLVEEILHDADTPWHRVVRRAAMFRMYGFSIQEWTAKIREDGIVGYKDIDPRAQVTIERWDTDRTGKVIGCVQSSPQSGEEIYLPREKLVYLVDDSLNDSPEGLGLFRHIVDPSQQLRRLEQLEGWGYETDLRGIPVTRAPLSDLDQLVAEGKITEDQKNQLIQPMVDFASGHIKNDKTGFCLDSATYQTTDDKQTPSNTKLWDVELVRGGGTSHVAVSEAIERKNREIARVLGVEGLLLGSDSAGSFALSRDKTNNFFLIVDSTLTEVRAQFQKDLVDTLFVLNNWNPELTPNLKFDPTSLQDVEQIATTLQKLAMAGSPLMPDDPAINEIRDIMGLSKADLDSIREMAAQEAQLNESAAQADQMGGETEQ